MALQVEVRRGRNIDDFREFFVHRIAFRLHVHDVAKQRNHFHERMLERLEMHVAVELLAQIIARKHQRAAGVLLLRQAKQICRETQLRLHFFFAIAKIIVGDDGDDDAGFIARGELEGVAAIVKIVLFFPAHAVAALAFGGLVKMRQADGFFRQLWSGAARE